MSIREWIQKLKILDPRRVKVLDVKLDMVDLEINGKVYKDVIPRRPFPYSHPEYVIFYDSNDEEIGILKDYRRLDKRSCELLEKALELIYFIPKIKKIISIQVAGRHFKWVVLTDKGMIDFETHSHCARMVGNGKVIIKDVKGMVYCIDNIYKLDSRSVAWLSFVL